MNALQLVSQSFFPPGSVETLILDPKRPPETKFSICVAGKNSRTSLSISIACLDWTAKEFISVSLCNTQGRKLYESKHTDKGLIHYVFTFKTVPKEQLVYIKFELNQRFAWSEPVCVVSHSKYYIGALKMIMWHTISQVILPLSSL